MCKTEWDLEIVDCKFGNLFNHSSSDVVPSRGTSLPLHLGSRVKLNIARLHEQLLVPLLHLKEDRESTVFRSRLLSVYLVLHGWHIDGSKCISVQADQLRRHLVQQLFHLRLSPLLHCLQNILQLI